MKIKREDIPSMTIEQFADAHNLVMVVMERRLPEGDPSRYYARFEHCEVGGDGFLRGEFGNGRTPEEAIADYATAITLKRIVVGAYTPERREIDVPRLLPNASSTGPEARP
jgi:hypothetical protein